MPFTHFCLNNLESISLLSSAITVYCGLFYIADNSFSDCKRKPINIPSPLVNMTEAERTVFFIAILSCHIIFAVYWLYHFITEVSDTIRKRATTLYLVCCFCYSQEQLLKHKHRDDLKEKIEPYLQIMDDIKTCKELWVSLSVVCRLQ